MTVFKQSSNRLPTGPNFDFGQIGANNDQIRLPGGQSNDIVQSSNRLQLDLITLLVKFSSELGPIMTRYDFLEARRVILSNVRADSNLTGLYFWPTLHVN